jgi:predicted phosphodiesterase
VIQKIGIIGDVHSEHRRLRQALDWLEQQSVDVVVCTGDVADGRGCFEQSWRALESARVHTVAGNHDRWLLTDKVRHVPHAQCRSQISDQGIEFLSTLPKVVCLETAAGELRLCHGVAEDDMAKVWPGTEETPIRRSEQLDDWLAEGRCPAFVINGHMHFRTLIDFDNCHLVNGGTLKGERAGITLLDLKLREISSFNLLDNGSICPARHYSLDERSSRRIWHNTAAFDGCWRPIALHLAA